MKRLSFAVGLNIAVFLFSAIALTSQWQILGGILCLFSYPSIFFLGWTWSKTALKVSITTTTETDRRTETGRKRNSRIDGLTEQ